MKNKYFMVHGSICYQDENQYIIALGNKAILDMLNKKIISKDEKKRYLSMLNLELEALEKNCAVCDTYISDFEEIIKIFENLTTEK